MIETTDIYRSIKRLLETSFPDILIQTKDIKTPAPPCFYIKYITGKTTQSASEIEIANCSFEIVYFAYEESLLELLEVETKLKEILKKPLHIELTDEIASEKQNQFQEINDLSITLNEQDYVLSCVISIEIEQTTGAGCDTGTDFINRFDEYNNDEFMEDLEI